MTVFSKLLRFLNTSYEKDFHFFLPNNHVDIYFVFQYEIQGINWPTVKTIAKQLEYMKSRLCSHNII